MSGAGRSDVKSRRKPRKAVQRAFRASQKTAGLTPRSHTTRPNRTSAYETVEQEQQARSEATLEHAQVIRSKLPVLLRKLATIPDPRNPLLITHKLTCLMIYGILMFVLQTGSRRKTNETLTAPAMKEQLLQLFPDLDSIPHHDTLYRLLSVINVDRIEEAQMEVVRSLIRDKKFSQYLIEGCYAIAIDGTQKLVRRQLPDRHWLQRKVGATENKKTQYYVYVLEANLVLSGGMSIPLMSEFLDYTKGDSEREKQDCEQRAFYRLAKRLKKAFPHLPIALLLDGMFAIGPVMQMCRTFHWHYLIVLQDGSLPQVWEEYRGLKRLLTAEEQLVQIWGDRKQQFHWVNEIQYAWGPNERKTLTLHLVVCEESWQEVDEAGQVVRLQARYAWISDLPFCKKTVHKRCNLGARHRWTIEEGFLVEKRQGYNYEHCYAYNWNAMRGFHYLMRIGHLLNVLAALSVKLVKAFKEKGPQGFIEFVRTTLSGLWLESSEVRRILSQSYQLRLVPKSHLPPIVL
jgi:hypothetical protein